MERIDADGEKLWRKVIDFIYKTADPNLFTTRVLGVSQFMKSFMQAAKVASFGFSWSVGDGKKDLILGG